MNELINDIMNLFEHAAALVLWRLDLAQCKGHVLTAASGSATICASCVRSVALWRRALHKLC